MSNLPFYGISGIAKATSIAVLGENDVLRRCTQRRLFSLLDEPRRMVASGDRKRKIPIDRTVLRVVLSFLSLFLELNVVKALTIGSPLAITQQLGESLQNVSLESTAEALYNSKGFALSPPESNILTSGSISAANLSAESLNTTLGTYVKCDGALGFGLSTASCYGMLNGPLIGMHDTTQKIWGERGSGAQVILPFRYVSRK